MRSETANSRCKQISCLFRVLQVSVKYQQVFLSSVRGTLLREISNVSQTLNMHLIIPTLLSFALGALAAPSISLDERQSQWTGTCILASNTCNITSPAGLAGLMVNCAAGAGLDGSIGRNQHNCTIDGHVSFAVSLSHCSEFGETGRFICSSPKYYYLTITGLSYQWTVLGSLL